MAQARRCRAGRAGRAGQRGTARLAAGYLYSIGRGKLAVWAELLDELDLRGDERAQEPHEDQQPGQKVSFPLIRLADDVGILASVEWLGSERGIIAKVEVDVTLERAIGVQRGPAAAAHIVALVGALP